MYVRDLQGHEFVIQATTTWEGELNANQTLSFQLKPNKVNLRCINDIDKMWEVVDDDGTTHKIVYCKKQGARESLTVDIKAIPLFFDVFDTQRIYDEYNEHMSANRCFSIIFENSGYNFVLNGTFEAIQWEGFGAGSTRLELFKKAIENYKAEYRIVGNTVYLENLIGRDTQFMYHHRLNASNIVIEHDATSYWTYAKGYGDFGDGGDWKDAKLIREYTSPIASLIGKREAPPIKDGTITTAAAMDKQLKTLVDESLKISVTADSHDLRRQRYPLAQPELGDRVFVIDERIGLKEEVRVAAMSIAKDWQGNVLDIKVTFGTDSVVKRHQSNLRHAVSTIQNILSGTIKLPFSVLDNAVAEATKALLRMETQLTIAENGSLLAVDKNNPNNVVVFNAAGLGVSTDGGATFANAITGLGINASVVTTGTMLADRIAGGVLSSLNNRTVFNLNSGRLAMQNTQFVLGGGADIEFTDPGNRLYFSLQDGGTTRSAGFGVGRSINDRFPFAFLGTSNGSKPHPMDSQDFTGFITNTKARTAVDNVGNSVVGPRFHVRDHAVSFSEAFLFDLSNTVNRFQPINAGTYDYDIGVPGNRFATIYLQKNPDISSDARLKTDIKPNDLGLDFIKDLKTYSFRLRPKKEEEQPLQYGIIAQQLCQVLVKHGVNLDDVSIVSEGDDGMYGAQLSQLIFPLIKGMQELIERIEKLESR